MQESQGRQVQSLGLEDPLAKGMATHSSQYSCLENPTDRGVWWTTVHGVTKELDMTWRLNNSEGLYVDWCLKDDDRRENRQNGS